MGGSGFALVFFARPSYGAGGLAKVCLSTFFWLCFLLGSGAFFERPLAGDGNLRGRRT